MTTKKKPTAPIDEKNLSPELIADVENYAQASVARVKLDSYFREKGWQCREDIPETLLVAYGLVAALRSRLESPEINAVLADSYTHVAVVLEEDGEMVSEVSLEDL